MCYVATVPNLQGEVKEDSDFIFLWNLEIVFSLYIRQL